MSIKTYENYGVGVIECEMKLKCEVNESNGRLIPYEHVDELTKRAKKHLQGMVKDIYLCDEFLGSLPLKEDPNQKIEYFGMFELEYHLIK